MRCQLRNINGMTYFNNKIYMILPHMSALLEYDFSKKQIKKVCDYPESVRCVGAFEKMIGHGNKIYLFPCRTESIYYYDTDTEKYKELLNVHAISENAPERIFFDVVIYQEFIYAVCCCPNIVVRIDLFDDNIQVWKLDDRLIDYHIVNHTFSACIYNDKILYPYSADMIIEFDISGECFHVLHLEGGNHYDGKYGYLHGMVINDTGKMWVHNWYGDVYEIDHNNMKRLEVPSELAGIYNDGLSEEQYKIIRILCANNKLYFILQSEHRILVYDICSNEFSWINNPFAVWNEASRKIVYSVYTSMDSEKSILYNFNDERMYFFDVNKGFIDTITLDIFVDVNANDAVMNEYLKNFFWRNDELRIYIQYIKEKRNNHLEE